MVGCGAREKGNPENLRVIARHPKGEKNDPVNEAQNTTPRRYREKKKRFAPQNPGKKKKINIPATLD